MPVARPGGGASGGCHSAQEGELLATNASLPAGPYVRCMVLGLAEAMIWQVEHRLMCTIDVWPGEGPLALDRLCFAVPLVVCVVWHDRCIVARSMFGLVKAIWFYIGFVVWHDRCVAWRRPSGFMSTLLLSASWLPVMLFNPPCSVAWSRPSDVTVCH